MFIVIEERSFYALHQIQFADGSWEPLHGHPWLLRLAVHARTLDAKEFVVDFLELQAILDRLLEPFHGKIINSLPMFAGKINPTAESLAWFFYCQLAPQIDDERVWLQRIELREAPSSWAIYERDP